MLLFIKMKIQYVYELFVKKNKYPELNINIDKLPLMFTRAKNNK